MMTTWYKIDDPENPPPREGQIMLWAGNYCFSPCFYIDDDLLSDNAFWAWQRPAPEWFDELINPTHWSPITPPETEE